jgi:nucleotide-binding universal stress UspA family protein
MTMNKVVVGIDGSPDSQLAMQWALLQARWLDAEVVAVHVYSYTLPDIPDSAVGHPETVDEVIAHAERRAARVIDEAVEAAGDLAKDITVTPRAIRGREAPQHLLAEARDAVLLVLGSRGLGGFTSLLLGSVSQKCVVHAPCAVLIAEPRADPVGRRRAGPTGQSPEGPSTLTCPMVRRQHRAGRLSGDVRMPSTIRAVAVDYDGTLTQSPRPTDDVLDAVATVRGEGRSVVLVTGRIIAELREDFPDVYGHFDAVVAENGAVLSRGGFMRDLVEAVDVRLGLALAHRDVPVRQGRVLLACDGVHAATVLEEVTRLGLDCQLVRNRAALMILPAGVTKATGLAEALAELGISRHSTIGVGDAENDHSLLSACEIAVAVADAVPALTEHADLVLEGSDGHGVRELLTGPVLRGERRVHSRRWQVEVGTDASGAPVRIPANQYNMLIIGASGGGKSYLAGLFTELVSELGYTALVLDAAGEYRPLGDLRGVLALGGNGEPLPPPDRLGDLLSHRFGSVILDLSLLPGHARRDYIAQVATTVTHHRTQTGLPHWMVLEEAHVLAGAGGPARELLGAGGLSHCLITYHPLELCPSVTSQMDLVFATGGDGPGADHTVAYLSACTGIEPAAVERALADLPPGGALLTRKGSHELVAVNPGRRHTSHVRHQRKYADAELPHHLRFYFSGGAEHSPRVAANIGQLHDILEGCGGSALDFHTQRGDLSRWIREVLTDTALADEIGDVEREHRTARDVEATRARLLQALDHRYLTCRNQEA